MDMEHPEDEPQKPPSWSGKVRLSPDWDSEETNEEIAREFYGDHDEDDPLLGPPKSQGNTRTIEP